MKMENKVLTISIAAYNVEKYIRNTLKTLCCRNIDKIEVFIIDDGGNDGTIDIAKEFERNYPGSFYAVHKTNGGLGSTYNYSIEHARGKYLKLLDGDDYFDTEALDELIELMEKVDADAIYTPYLTFDDVDGSIISHYDISNRLNSVLPISELDSFTGLVMHSLSFKTKMLQKGNFKITEHCFYVDTEYITKSLFFSKTICFSNYEVYHYRLGREGQSVALSGFKKHYKEAIIVAKEIMSFFISNSNDPNSVIVFYNIKNIVKYIRQSLLVLGMKKEFVEFDTVTKQFDNLYELPSNKTLKILRFTNYLFFYLFSFLFRKLF